MIVTFEVAGTPAPKGSMRAVPIQGGRAALAPGGSDVGREKLKSWNVAVREAAAAIWGAELVQPAGPLFVDTPLFVQVVFRVARPASQWHPRGGLRKSAPAYPLKKPDLDKLVRATMDAMKGTIYDDDARIVAKIPVKVFAAPGRESATITVMKMTDDLLRSLVGDLAG